MRKERIGKACLAFLADMQERMRACQQVQPDKIKIYYGSIPISRSYGGDDYPFVVEANGKVVFRATDFRLDYRDGKMHLVESLVAAIPAGIEMACAKP